MGSIAIIGEASGVTKELNSLVGTLRGPTYSCVRDVAVSILSSVSLYFMIRCLTRTRRKELLLCKVFAGSFSVLRVNIVAL